MDALQSGAQLSMQTCRRHPTAPGPSADHHVFRGFQLVDDRLRHMPQPSRHPVPFYRRSDRLGDDQTDQRTRRAILGRLPGVDHDCGLNRPPSVPDRRTEISRSPHPVPGREHRRGTRAQAVSERRPLRRRPVTIARPARVRIRRRKPCTRARRRLFGWKVRLPLATAHSPRCVLRRFSRAHPRPTGPSEGDALGKSR
jgi:hypothetical protein